jgi:energy-converting hydrogenase Eha subunit G
LSPDSVWGVTVALLAAQVETEAARALWLSGRVEDLAGRIERILRSRDLDALSTVRLRAAYALACTRTLPGDAVGAVLVTASMLLLIFTFGEGAGRGLGCGPHHRRAGRLGGADGRVCGQ